MYIKKGQKSYIIIVVLFNVLFCANASIPEKLESLKKELSKNDIPESWFIKNIHHEKYTVYYEIQRYFASMAENKVKNNEKDINWYMNHFGVEKKIIQGNNFYLKNKKVLDIVYAKTSISPYLIVALIAIESNFADPIYKGNFYTFPALVSQYVLLDNRKNYAVEQLIALYQFEKKIDKPTYYFIGSFAGAVGPAQFIPVSLLNYFTPSNGIYENTDLYSLENSLYSIGTYIAETSDFDINQDDPEILHQAIFSYNRSDAYVKAVSTIYNELKILNSHNP